MTLKSLFRPLLLAITLLPLSACSALVGPKDLTIEYDEEVKLHDGEMIWVHITRHYIEGGGKEISEMFRGGGKNVIPTYVEISWDTGFEGVGRKSVFFDNVMSVSKYDGEWYVTGSKGMTNSKIINESLNCTEVGVSYGNGCTVAINSQGFFKPDSNSEKLVFKGWNILYPIGIKDWGSVPRPLDGKKITWSEKIELESQQSERFKRITKASK
ncbi:hypothetical protein [Psychrobacter sp. TB55-MNA-CIBAN-0194]|uniref:hypothetical protein n=1 Tax=Psychrobacter sp. TB55-MNA-CIBAN-0194 TaxID=3140445 RepID=UPI003323BB8D